MSEENKINENMDIINNIEKRKSEASKEELRIRPPIAKVKIRESLNDKAKQEKMYICNANDVIFFKISNHLF